jgi:O-antigen ligase
VVALAVSFLFILFKASAKQRLAGLVVAVTLAISAPLFLKGNTAERLGTLFGGQHEEAAESGAARSYLLKLSVIYTFQHPIFGVGLGQFSNYEGAVSQSEGKRGNWHETHNAFTEVSSECGIAAFIFFTLGIGSAMMSVNRTYRRARKEGYPEIANACFCYLLSMVGYMVSIFFLANAFRFYLPLMIGLAIALSAAAEREMGGGRVKEPVRTTGWVGPISARTRMAQS